jgi:hypothetical protein
MERCFRSQVVERLATPFAIEIVLQAAAVLSVRLPAGDTDIRLAGPSMGVMEGLD